MDYDNPLTMLKQAFLHLFFWSLTMSFILDAMDYYSHDQITANEAVGNWLMSLLIVAVFQVIDLHSNKH